PLAFLLYCRPLRAPRARSRSYEMGAWPPLSNSPPEGEGLKPLPLLHSPSHGKGRRFPRPPFPNPSPSPFRSHKYDPAPPSSLAAAERRPGSGAYPFNLPGGDDRRHG